MSRVRRRKVDVVATSIVVRAEDRDERRLSASEFKALAVVVAEVFRGRR